MKRLALTCALATGLSACFSDQKSDTTQKLVDAGALSANHKVLMNYFAGGWDFYSHVGLLETKEQPKIKCDRKYRAHVEILLNQLEQDFKKREAPNKSMIPLRDHPLGQKNGLEVCEAIVRNERGQWFGALILDQRLIYFENRHEPHDLSVGGFRYVKHSGSKETEASKK